MLDRAVVQRYESFEFVVNQLVEGFMTGLHKSPFHGFSVEFAEHKIYNNGDSIKHIDWKLYARTDKLFVKSYEEETNLRCYLLVDNSSSMYYPVIDNPTVNKPDKITFSCYAAACIANLLQRQRDAIGLSLFSEDIQLFTPVRSSYQHLQYLYTQLEKLIINNKKERTKAKKSNLAESLDLLAEKIHKRSLIIVFSDMFDNYSDKEKLFSSLQHLKYSNNEVVLFNVSDFNKEFEFEFPEKPTKFVDIETKIELKVNPNLIKKEFSKLQKELLQEINHKCQQYRIDFINADINKGYDNIMLSFLKKRQKLH